MRVVFYNINAIATIDTDRNLVWFLGESEGVDVGRADIERIFTDEFRRV